MSAQSHEEMAGVPVISVTYGVQQGNLHIGKLAAEKIRAQDGEEIIHAVDKTGEEPVHYIGVKPLSSTKTGTAIRSYTDKTGVLRASSKVISQIPQGKFTLEDAEYFEGVDWFELTPISIHADE